MLSKHKAAIHNLVAILMSLYLVEAGDHVLYHVVEEHKQGLAPINAEMQFSKARAAIRNAVPLMEGGVHGAAGVHGTRAQHHAAQAPKQGLAPEPAPVRHKAAIHNLVAILM